MDISKLNLNKNDIVVVKGGEVNLVALGDLKTQLHEQYEWQGAIVWLGEGQSLETMSLRDLMLLVVKALGCPKCKDGWICERHPELAWPHPMAGGGGDCPGPGMPCDERGCPDSMARQKDQELEEELAELAAQSGRDQYGSLD